MKFNTIIGMTLLLGSLVSGETIIAQRSFGSYVHNAKCPQFHFNDTTVFHIDPQYASVQLFMGKEKQNLIPYFDADAMIKKSLYNEK
ncbi:hypothetical protein H8356DRAFT_419395 [Neocallimastix lanati (nom. inval.)]|nr:hypothetical protein H8356DRAFT_419395 [Neocallimastix sp. JGI-2020a]